MLLALQPHHRLHREQLMEMLWPDLDPEAAVNNLNKTIHMVRRAPGYDHGRENLDQNAVNFLGYDEK